MKKIIAAVSIAAALVGTAAASASAVYLLTSHPAAKPVSTPAPAVSQPAPAEEPSLEHQSIPMPPTVVVPDSGPSYDEIWNRCYQSLESSIDEHNGGGPTPDDVNAYCRQQAEELGR